MKTFPIVSHTISLFRPSLFFPFYRNVISGQNRQKFRSIVFAASAELAGRCTWTRTFPLPPFDQ